MAQSQRINDLIKPNTTDKFLNQEIIEAKPNLKGFLKLASCQNNDKYDLSAGKFTSPSAGTIFNPKRHMKYHPLDQCLTVQSIGQWYVTSQQ